MTRRNGGTDYAPTRKMLVACAKWIARSAALLVIACTTSGEHAGQAAAAGAPRAREGMASNAQATQQRFLNMFARSYFPGRTGQLLIVPREGDFITRHDQDVPYMHGSPWAYDVAIPLMFVGPTVRVGTYSMPAVQQDVAPTLAAALGVHMPPTSTGRILPVLKTGMARARVVVLIGSVRFYPGADENPERFSGRKVADEQQGKKNFDIIGAHKCYRTGFTRKKWMNANEMVRSY